MTYQQNEGEYRQKGLLASFGRPRIVFTALSLGAADRLLLRLLAQIYIRHIDVQVR